MDILAGIVILVVGVFLINSGVFEFKLRCITDWFGALLGLLMLLVGGSVIFGAL